MDKFLKKTDASANTNNNQFKEKSKILSVNPEEDDDGGLFNTVDRSKHELWIEKYRPKKLTDIVGNDKNLEQIHKWFTDFKAKKPGTKRALLLGGAPGLGKTSLAHVILEEYGYQIKEYNASDVRSKKLVQLNLYQLINISLVDKLVDENCKPIGIIMDEVDGMSAGDKGGMAELIQFINPNRGKRSVKKEDRESAENRWIPPIICICNSRHDKKILSLKKDCLEIVFQKPLATDLIQIIDRVCQNEQFEIAESSKKLIANYAQGDFRRLLFLLQNLYIIHGSKSMGNKKSIISDADVISQYQLFCQKEVELSLYETIDNLLNKRLTPTETLKIYESDKSLLPMMVHENYVNFIAAQGAPTVFCQLEEIQDCIDSIIEGDIIDKTMYNNQSWHLQPIHGLNSCFIPSYYINKYQKPYFQKSKFTTALGKFSLHCSNRKNVNGIISTVNGKFSYNIEDIRVLSELILYNAFIKDAKGLLGDEDEIVRCNDICVHFLKKYNLAVDDIDKLIKMNKLNGFYKDLTSICRTKTVLKKIYGDDEPYYRAKKTLNKSLSSINCTIMSKDNDGTKPKAQKKGKAEAEEDDGEDKAEGEDKVEGEDADDLADDEDINSDEEENLEEDEKPKKTASVKKTVKKSVTKTTKVAKTTKLSIAKKQVADVVQVEKIPIKKILPKIAPKN